MLLTTLTLLLQAAAATTPPVADARVRRDASAAQARFERERRANLPREHGGGYATRCDAQIGRYCYWYDSTQKNAVPEPTRITAARDKLLGVLAAGAAINPLDGWISGQRVRYLMEAGRGAEAIASAEACRAQRWWCLALSGLALHAAERYADADAAFAGALREMPEQQRCAWLDLRKLAPNRLDSELGAADCRERAERADRLWLLSQPLWVIPGNDLRTEHFARLTMAEILERAENAHGLSWSSDSRELLLRYGWAEWYTRQETSPYSASDGRPRVTGHDREPSYFFFPDLPSVRGPPRLTDESWQLRLAAAPTRYAPRHLNRLADLPHQLTRLSLGDSMRLVVVFSPRDTALAKDSTSARVLALIGDTVIAGSVSANGRTATLVVPRRPLVMSVEVQGARSKRAARARYTVDPLSCVPMCTFDLLLFRPRENADTTFERALERAIDELRHSVRDPLGIFWEVERATGMAEPVWVDLTITRSKVGRLRRLATRLHLGPAMSPVRLRWRMALEGKRSSGSVNVRLPELARGAHHVLLRIEPADGPPLRAEREIFLTP